MFALVAKQGAQDSAITSLIILAPKNQVSTTKLRITSMATASARMASAQSGESLFISALAQPRLNFSVHRFCVEYFIKTPSYHHLQLTTLGGWHVQHSATLRNKSASPRMSDEHAIAE
jgi:hypothetical protein